MSQRLARHARCLLLVASSIGCDKEPQARFRDTEGRRFSCEEDRCRSASAEREGQRDAFALKRDSRLVGVCKTASDGQRPRLGACRALVCESDSDCPPDRGTPAGHCINGLCVDPARALASDDAVMLCLAGTGLGRKTPLQIERYAMALNCGSPCKIPRPCRQP